MTTQSTANNKSSTIKSLTPLTNQITSAIIIIIITIIITIITRKESKISKGYNECDRYLVSSYKSSGEKSIQMEIIIWLRRWLGFVMDWQCSSTRLIIQNETLLKN